MGSAALAVTLAAWRAGQAVDRLPAADARSSSTRPSSTSSSARKASRSRRSSSSSIIVTSLISRVMRSTELRVHGVDAGRDGAAVHPGGRRRRRSGSSPTGPTSGDRDGVRAQAARGARLASPAARRARAVRRGPAGRRVGVQRTGWRCTGVDVGGHHVLRCVSPAIPNAIAALLLYMPRRDRQDPARLLRLDRRQPDRLPAEVPGVRRRGHGAGHARSAAAGGARSAAPAADSRRVDRSPERCVVVGRGHRALVDAVALDGGDLELQPS